MVNGFEHEDALEAAEEEWESDSAGKYMSREDFRSSLYELVDIWTATTELVDYLHFLDSLYSQITKSIDILADSDLEGASSAGDSMRYLELDEIEFNAEFEVESSRRSAEVDVNTPISIEKEQKQPLSFRKTKPLPSHYSTYVQQQQQRRVKKEESPRTQTQQQTQPQTVSQTQVRRNSVKIPNSSRSLPKVVAKTKGWRTVRGKVRAAVAFTRPLRRRSMSARPAETKEVKFTENVFDVYSYTIPKEGDKEGVCFEL